MNLAAYILAATASQQVHPNRSEGQLEHLKVLHRKNRSQTDSRYFKVLSKGRWLSTYEVECMLGLSRFCAKDKLNRLLAEKLVARRNRNGEKKYNPKRGYEWLWSGPAIQGEVQ